MQQVSEQTALMKLKAYFYMRHAINNPLSGMLDFRKALKNTGLNEEQMTDVHVTDSCHHQLHKIFSDLDQDNIIHKPGCLSLEMTEFVLQNVFVAAVSQVLVTCHGMGIRVSCNLPERLWSFIDSLHGSKVIS
ncbi:hypothetical protein ABZP36_009157 [Zizania latifolia]